MGQRPQRPLTTVLVLLCLATVSHAAERRWHAAPVTSFIDHLMRDALEGPHVGPHVRRQTINGGEVSDNFLGIGADGTADIQGYGMWLVGQVGAFFVLAFASLLVIIPFLLFRCCCCGTYNVGHGFCCNKKSRGPKHYTKAVVIGHKIAMTAAVVAIIVCVIFTYMANAQFTTAFLGLFGAIIDAFSSLVQRITTISNLLTSLPYTASMGATLQPAANTANDFLQMGKNYQAQIAVYDSYRSIAVNVAAAAPCGLLLIMCILGWLNIAPSPIVYIFFALIMILLFVNWMSAGIQRLLFLLLSDLCTYLKTLLNAASSNPITALLTCSNTTQQALSSLQNAAHQGLDSATNQVCQISQQICQINVTLCPSSCDQSTLPLFMNVNISAFTTWSPLVKVPITVGNCPVNCQPGDTQATMSYYVGNMSVYNQYYDVLNNQIIPLLSCTFMTTLISNIETDICDPMVGMVGATFNIANAQISASVFIFVGVVILIRGSKRFKKRHQMSNRVESDDYEMKASPQKTASGGDKMAAGESSPSVTQFRNGPKAKTTTKGKK